MSAVQPTLTDPQPDALEVGTTATKAVKGCPNQSAIASGRVMSRGMQ